MTIEIHQLFYLIYLLKINKRLDMSVVRLMRIISVNLFLLFCKKLWIIFTSLLIIQSRLMMIQQF